MKTISIAVGTNNEPKLDAVRHAFASMFGAELSIHGPNVGSGVRDQPWGDEEIRAGARTRAERARLTFPHVAYSVGIESGIVEFDSAIFDCAWVAVIDAKMHLAFARSVAFPLPPNFAEQLRKGETLSDVMSSWYGKPDIGKREGAVGYFTKGAIDRKAQMVPAIQAALIPFLHRKDFELQP